MPGNKPKKEKVSKENNNVLKFLDTRKVLLYKEMPTLTLRYHDWEYNTFVYFCLRPQ
jgi:hypothetical protein